FDTTIANTPLSLGVQFIFILITILVVSKGIQNGIERMSKIMMPALAILFLILVARSVTLPNAMEGIQFLFQPDFNKVTSHTVLEAMGQYIFTLSLCVSVIIKYLHYISIQ